MRSTPVRRSKSGRDAGRFRDVAAEILEARRVLTPVVAPSGLVAWWTGDNGANDVTGNNSGALFGTTIAPGKVGNAFSFDGTDDRLFIPDNPDLALRSSLTIEGWVNVNAFPSSGGGMVFFRGDNRFGLDPIVVGVNPSGIMAFHIDSGNGTADVTAPISTNQWVYLAATLDAATGAMSLYLNGTLADQITTACRPFGALDPTANPGVGIGNANGGQGGYNVPFDGLIDELSVYNRALTQGEIQGIYNAGSDGKVLAPPTLSGVSASQLYVQGTTPLAIAPNVVVSEPNNVILTSATVSFTNWQGEDRLAFINSAALQHTFTQDLQNNATLTLTGNASAAAYQTVLQSVTYQDVAGNPNTSAVRMATIRVNDSNNSASANQNLSVVSYLSGVIATVNYLQGSPPLSIAPNLLVTPPAGLSIQSAAVTFSNWQGEDRLAFFNSAGLPHTFTEDLNAHTARLTITGTATAADYQKLLRSVTYQDVAGNPNTSPRVATIGVNDGTNTVSAVENVTVTKVDQPPEVQVVDSTQLTYKVNSPSIAIMKMALVTDPDSNNLSSLTVQISSGFQAGHDMLSFVNKLGISGSYNASTGLLTLTGSSYVGNYRQALRAVMFQTTGSGVSTATRTFTVITTDSTNAQSTPVTRNLTVTP
jgi:hypothetical protein